MSARGAIETLERVAGGAARMVRKLALAAGAAAAVIALFLFSDGVPDDANEWAVTVIVLGLALVPPVVLFILSEALKALSELPRRIRSAPADAGERLSELGRVGESLRGAGAGRLPFVVWRLGRTAASSRELLTPHAAVLPLASLPFLGLAAASMAGAVLEIVVALVLLVLLAT